MNQSHPLAEFSVGSAWCSLKGRRSRLQPALNPLSGGFTLMELMVVVAVIAILAGLTLSTLGYVNAKGAMSRAQSEVAALSAAIESYKLETGSYPTNTTALYSNLVLGSKVHFEPIPSILTTNSGRITFTDPWGTAYGYSNYTTYFELWSTAGGKANQNDWIRN